MPCKSDYLDQSGKELESIRVFELIIFLYHKVAKEIPVWVFEGHDEYYGNTGRLDEGTMMLCQCCRSLTDVEKKKYIYDVHDETSRKLASWWERHQEWDARRVKEEKETRGKIILKGRALKKLSVDEIDALGL